MKKILFFTYGDANKPATWSNVPYLFSRTLEKKGIDVIRINIAPNKYINALFSRVLLRLLTFFYPDHKYSFIRMPIYRFFANRVIKKAIKNHQPDLCFFSNFDFIKPDKNIPTVLFSDWTYDILVRERLSRPPYFFERAFISHQEKAINSADLVISLFEKCAKEMNKVYPNANVVFLGGNVVNSLYNGNIILSELIMKKQISNKILFIGGKHYKSGAQTLINAFNILDNCQYELHIIGLTRSDLKNCSDKVYCYGYLDKNLEDSRNTYYKLMSSAKYIANPTPIWAGYSSTIEAMYFATPVIVPAYMEFVAEFGDDIDFGFYLEDCSEKSVSKILSKAFSLSPSEYKAIAEKAHFRVKDYSWESYVDRFLVKLNQVIKN
ncbi:glycosyltransferase family protein [Exercitatus varius]|uniref:Glycosyltransferase n=1 Tax=Exercitatus varius TaxID=67857 RepID=A0AAW6QCV8_9PAST|nr:hypothetical protein [Exercitatus varius]MDG2949978.1 hypothetical protein [Exercitatus varius]